VERGAPQGPFADPAPHPLPPAGPHDSFQEFLKHLHLLWGFTVRLEAVDEGGKVELVGECPQSKGR
jgi:hypothetical protein